MIALKGGIEIYIEIANIITGVLVLVGTIIAGGAIYAGLEKNCKSNRKTKMKSVRKKTIFEHNVTGKIIVFRGENVEIEAERILVF
jgi:hypothetical protein